MIMDEIYFSDKEYIEDYIIELKKNIFGEDSEAIGKIYKDFLFETFDADKKLQEMVSNRFGDNYISIVIIPTKETEALDSFYFQLFPKNEEKVKRRVEIIYQDFCKICFENVKPVFIRLMEYFDRLESGLEP